MAENKNLPTGATEDGTVPTPAAPKKAAGIEMPASIWKKPAAESTEEEKAPESPLEKTEPPKSKIEQASAATTNRAEVIQDARRRSAERDQANELRERFFSGWAHIQAAMQKKLVLRGNVVSVYVRWKEDPNSGLEYPFVFVTAMLDDLYKISIPFQELFSREAIDMSTVDLTTQDGLRKFARRQQTMAAKFVGVEISFLITHMDNIRECTIEDHFIAGSRKKALEKERLQNFFSLRNGLAPRIKVGDDVEATIIGVGPHSIRVCVGGLDVSIRMYELTYRWIPNATEEFMPGQKIRLRITSLETNPDELKIVRFGASMKPLERESALMRAGFINPNMQVHGIITAIVSVDEDGNPRQRVGEKIDVNSGGKIVAFAWLPGLKMPARISGFPPFRYGSYTRTGDEVVLSINRMTESGVLNAHLVRKVGFQI